MEMISLMVPKVYLSARKIDDARYGGGRIKSRCTSKCWIDAARVAALVEVTSALQLGGDLAER
jgi:hypothetical protein